MKTEKKFNIDGRVLPNNFEAEQVVLGCALMDNESALMVIGKLEENDFYNETHREIFTVIKQLLKQSQPIDFVTVADELEKKNKLGIVGGMEYISNLSTIIPSSAGCSSYIEIIKRDSVLRQVIQASGNIIEKAYEKDADINLIGIAEKEFFEIAEKGQSSSLERFNTLEIIENFESIHREGGSIHGLKTGFYQIDKATNGLQKTDLIILAARPGVGKTSLAMNIVTNAAINSNAKCAVFSLEMGREQLERRMLCSVADVSMAKALRGELNSNDWQRIWKAKEKLDNAEIYIDDNSMNTPSQILSKCRKLKREKGLDLVVIDYIGLMKSDEKSDNRQNEVANISRQLKILAKDIQVPVLCLCQLNRAVEQSTNKEGKPRKPVLSDLRESGSIEQDADMVWFIHRDMTRNEINKDPDQNYIAELIIAKFRNGQPGSIFLGWDGSKTSFVNLERDANEQSLVNAYENQMRQPQQESIESIRERLNTIITEVDTKEEELPFPKEYQEQNTYIENGMEEEPPFNPENDIPDFSNVSIPDDDDELF